MEAEDVVDAQTAQRWFKRFSEGNTSLEDQTRFGRPTVIDDEALRLAVKQEPSTSTRILSTEFGTSRSTINNHLNKLGFVNRRCRQVPHELTPNQARDRIDICKRLLENPLDERQFKRIVACDVMWIYYRNPDKRNQWLHSGQPANTVARIGRFEDKVMLSVWWNYEGILHFELVPDGHAVDADLYSQQLDRVYATLRDRYPALVNRKHALLQQDNVPAHRAKLSQQKIKELDGIELLPYSAYSPNLAPSDYYLFREMTHFLSGRRFKDRKDVEMGCREFFASKSKDWYLTGIERKMSEDHRT